MLDTFFNIKSKWYHSLNSGVKTWKFTSNFWHMKDMNIPSEKIPGYKHKSVRDRIFMTSQRLNMTDLATIVYLVNRIS